MTKTLIVSPDTKLLHRLKMILTLSGFEVQTASSPAEAKKLIHEVRFKLILADIHGHKKDIFKSIKKWKNQGMNLPVLYMGENAIDDVMVMASRGLNEFIVKPFTFNHLKQKLSLLMSLQEQGL
jgi:two-component system OmpR family response regulator